MGLGNPGETYRHTRHNVGEDVVRRWASNESVSLKRLKTFGEVVSLPGQQIDLAVPAGFMNTSGRAVAGLTRYLKVDPAHLVVIHDDLDLDPGVIRLKLGGGHGGHNGVRDIEKALGTPDFLRVRIGIGRPPGRMDPAKYVLDAVTGREREQWALTLEHALDATQVLIDRGLAQAQQIVHAP